MFERGYSPYAYDDPYSYLVTLPCSQCHDPQESLMYLVDGLYYCRDCAVEILRDTVTREELESVFPELKHEDGYEDEEPTEEMYLSFADGSATPKEIQGEWDI